MKRYYIIISALFILLTTCQEFQPTPKEVYLTSDLEKIREKGKMVVVTDYNSTNYFIYRGQPMGYQFDLLQELADYMGVKLEVTVNNDLSENFNQLLDGEVDLIATNLTVTKERKKFVDFTVPHSQACQVLIQRKPEGWEYMKKDAMDEKLIRNQLDLAGKTIYFQSHSSHAARLKNLSDEIGDSINMVEVNEDFETLINKVSTGEIDFTVSDEHVAYVNQMHYPNIDIETKLSFPQNMAWAVRKGSTDFRDEINNWLSDFTHTKRFKLIYAKYFNNHKSSEIVGSDLYAINSGKISDYDKAIKRYSKEIGWDWRLVASLIYQESRFKPDAVSWAGAYGLMQLMPITAERMGIDESASPVEQIKAGTELIKWLEERFEHVEDRSERIKFVLASYNVGFGHVIDARNLARKDGKNPDIWDDSVDLYLLKKSNPDYYNDPVVKYGYCRGLETYNYVSQILDRYEHYKNIIKD
ncbi:MAG TPA: transporter substrate-binding domain-containing protein [Bacteroidales bacterium]|nr:transporter substrate-binding domain-containing protein [Bacteroidales bacterium]